jgi:hypothetical protein
MKRITYEIGARGEDSHIEPIIVKLRSYGDYYTGRWNEPTVKSVQRQVWLEETKTVAGFLSQLTGWCGQLSKENPEVEVFLTLTEIGGDEVKYASFQKGEFYTGESIITHSRLTEVLDKCDCELRPGYFESRPHMTPFSDCPVRVNPPTKWALENIMYAHESIGMR